MVDWTGEETLLVGPKQWKGALVYTALLVMTVIVPVLSIGHYTWSCHGHYTWSWHSGLTFEDPENKINTWLMLFPMMGLLMFI